MHLIQNAAPRVLSERIKHIKIFTLAEFITRKFIEYPPDEWIQGEQGGRNVGYDVEFFYILEKLYFCNWNERES